MKYLLLLISLSLSLYSEQFVSSVISDSVESSQLVNTEFGQIFTGCDDFVNFGDLITDDINSVCSSSFDGENISWISYQYKVYLASCEVLETINLSVVETRYIYLQSTGIDLICVGICDIEIPLDYQSTSNVCGSTLTEQYLYPEVCGCSDTDGRSMQYARLNPDYEPTCGIDCSNSDLWQSDLDSCNLINGQFNMTCDDSVTVCSYSSTCSSDNNSTDSNSTDNNTSNPDSDSTDDNTSEPIDDPFGQKDVPCGSHPYTKPVEATPQDGRWSDTLNMYYNCECIDGYIFDSMNERCVQDYNDDEPPCNNCEQARQRAQGLCEDGISQDTCIEDTCQYMFSCKLGGSFDDNSTSDDYVPPSPDANGTVAMDLSPLLEKMDDTSNRNSKDLNAIKNQIEMANSALDILHQDNRKSHNKLDRIDSTLKGIDNTNNKILSTNQGILGNTALTATATQKSANSLDSIDGKMDDLIDGVGKLDKNISFDFNGTGIYDKSMLAELEKINDMNGTDFADLNSTGLKDITDKLYTDINKIEASYLSFKSLLKNGFDLQLPDTSMPILSVNVLGTTLELDLCLTFSYFRPVLTFIFTVILLLATIKLYLYGFSKAVSNG